MKAPRLVQLAAGLAALRLVDARNERADARVHDLEAGDDVADVREARDDVERLRRCGVTHHEARLLPLAEVLAHRRNHDDERRERIGIGRLPRLGGGREVVRRVLELRRGDVQEGCIRQHLAELDRSVAVEVGGSARHLGGKRLGKRAPERALGQVVEVARLLEDATVGKREIEGDGARRILGGARAGVDDHVVLRERGRARDDPLHPLVVGIPLDPVLLHVLDELAHLGGARLPERLVIEVRGFGEVVVPLRVGGEVRSEARELARVLEQVVLDGGQIGGRRRRRGRLSRLGRGGRLGRVVTTPAARGERQHRRPPPRSESQPWSVHPLAPLEEYRTQNVRRTLQPLGRSSQPLPGGSSRVTPNVS